LLESKAYYNERKNVLIKAFFPISSSNKKENVFSQRLIKKAKAKVKVIKKLISLKNAKPLNVGIKTV
jgi:hypothetical protein